MKPSFAKTFTLTCAIGFLTLGILLYGGVGTIARSATTTIRGFFLLSHDQYNGNLLGYAKTNLGYAGSNGLEAADAICLHEVNVNGFLGKPAGKTYKQDEVYAFLCDGGNCRNLLPKKTYAMGRLGTSTHGGQTFTTDDLGAGPGDTVDWSQSSALDLNALYWMGRGIGSSNNLWPVKASGDERPTCSAWTSADKLAFNDSVLGNPHSGGIGASNKTDFNRWARVVSNVHEGAGCDTPLNLVCVAESASTIVGGPGAPEGNANTCVIPEPGAPPQEVCTAQDLMDVSLNLCGNYVQTCNIDLAGVAWTPIGKDPASASATASPFKGTYDGGEKKIINLTINDPSSAGLFASSEGTIERVTLQNANVKGQEDVGTLVAVNFSSAIARNTASTGIVEGKSNSNIGGLVGRNFGLVADSSANVAVSNAPPAQNAPDLTSLGGLVGNNSGIIKNSYASGAVSGKDARLVGGLVGNNTVTSSGVALIDNSSASGAVTNINTSSMGFAMGGLVGASNGSFDAMAEIKNSYATGSAQSISTLFVGGLVGVVQASKISRSYATGEIKGGTVAGGLIGMVESSGFPQAVIENVDAWGNVNVANGYAGGLIGLLLSNASLTNSYAIGKISAGRGSSKGGLIALRGEARSTPVASSYWDTATSTAKTSAGGSGRETKQMKTQKNYRRWDFVDVWSIKEGLKYPVLRSGFFLLSHDTYNGNLLGYARTNLGYTGGNSMEAADAICFNEVNARRFMGKPAGKVYKQEEVYAFLCDSGSCQNLLPRKTYAMGRLGTTERGGQMFTTDANGSGPGDGATWSNPAAFDSNASYWTSRFNTPASTKTNWATSPGVGGAYCSNWSSSNPNPLSSPGGYGDPTGVDASRWSVNVANCGIPHNLICVAESPRY